MANVYDLRLESFDPKTVARGRSYAEGGAVGEIREGERGVTAYVAGTRRAPYGVHIPFSRGTRQLDPQSAACTCPMGVMCKHIVAVIVTYHGHVPWGVFPGDVPGKERPGRARSSTEMLGEIERIMRESSKAPDTLLPLEGAAGPRGGSRIGDLLPARPSRSASSSERWRVAFVVSEHSHGEWRRRQGAAAWFRPRASIAPVSQYIRKDGTPGRMEGFREDSVHETRDAAADTLLRGLGIEGGEAPLLLHWDHILNHPHLPLYLAGRDGRGSYDDPLQPCRITRIQIGFRPEPLGEHANSDISMEPVLRVDLAGEGTSAPQEMAWADAWRGRLVALVADRWLGWCDGDDRLLTLVSHLAAYKPHLDRGEAALLKQKIDAEKSPLVVVDLPFRRVRLVTTRPQADLVLQQEEQGTTAELSFRYPAEDEVAGSSGNEERVLPRPDKEFEQNIATALQELFLPEIIPARQSWVPVDGAPHWMLRSTLAAFLADFGEGLLSRGIGLCIGDTTNRLSRTSQRLQVRVSSGIDWFDLSVSAGEEIDLSGVDPADPLFAHGFVRNGGRIIYIGAEEAEKLRAILGLLDPSQRAPRVPRLDLNGAAVLHDLVLQDAPPELKRAAEISRALGKPAAFGRSDPPRSFRGELRDYQRIGYGWLSFLAQNGLNGCLADDMGLGKTVQALAFLQALKQKKASRGASLVVAPVSTLQNWRAEAERFTPALRTVVHHGIDRSRDAADFKAVDLVIVSYATLRVDQEMFSQREWVALILDEAQSIKNPASQSFGVVKKLKSRHRFTLTGTPLENSVIDLWAQIDFLEPGLLGSLNRFRKRFGSRGTGTPDAERERLRKIVKPFILRRTKEVVEKSLPPKEEITFFAEMGARQRAAYDALKEGYRKRIALALKTRGIAGSGALIFEGLLRLRQAACFPEHANPSLKGVPSAKRELLEDLLGEIVAEGHRVLVFSQFVQSLKAIAASLDSRTVRYAYLDGSTRNRQEIIDNFQGDPRIPLFLLSLKAGGLGINLTAADYVVLFDPWWNPAVERQAVDRSHRIGQAKPVFVYRLITRDSIEERILALQEQKRALAAELIEENPRSLLALGEEELIGLFG